MSTKKKKSKVRSSAQLCNWEDLPSPYRKPQHVRWRKFVRKFVQEHVEPYIDKWEKNLDIPTSFYRKCYEYGIYAYAYPKEFGGTPFEGMEGHKDPFMSIILYDEICRIGSAGFIGAVFIHYVAVAPVILFGSDYLKNKMRDVIQA
eukprot:849607_1